MTETLNFAWLKACECMLKNLQRSNECKWKPQCSNVWNKNTQSFTILYIFNQIIYLLNFKLNFFKKCCQSRSHRSDDSQNVISNILEITIPQVWPSSHFVMEWEEFCAPLLSKDLQPEMDDGEQRDRISMM